MFTKFSAIFTFVLLTAIGSLLFLYAAESAQITPKSTAQNLPTEKLSHDRNLQQQADDLLHLFEFTPSVTVFLTDKPLVKNGNSIERGVAYTTCDQSNKPMVFIKKEFYESVNQIQLTNILKHELTHAWLCRQGLMDGHDANFHKKFKSIGGFGN